MGKNGGIDTAQTLALLEALRIIAELDKDNMAKHMERIIEAMQKANAEAIDDDDDDVDDDE